jgi:hypothetical protein
LTEYEERWRWQLEARCDAPIASLVTAMRHSSYGDAVLDALVESSVVRMSAPDFFEWRGLWLANLLRSVRGSATLLIDLGGGAGKNLPSQALAGFERIVVVEPTRSGCEALGDMARRIRLPVSVLRGKLPDLPLRLDRRGVVFTNHVLEQVPGRLDACLDAIIGLGDVRVVNIEPSFLPRSWMRHPIAESVDAFYRHRRNYGGGLSINLALRRARGEISILRHASCRYSPRVVNVPTLAVWEPRLSP